MLEVEREAIKLGGSYLLQRTTRALSSRASKSPEGKIDLNS